VTGSVVQDAEIKAGGTERAGMTDTSRSVAAIVAGTDREPIGDA